jgi:hypothetical protein
MFLISLRLTAGRQTRHAREPMSPPRVETTTVHRRVLLGLTGVWFSCAPPAPASAPPHASPRARAHAELEARVGETIAVRSTVRLLPDPRQPDRWIRAADEHTRAEHPACFAFRLVGVEGSWLHVESDLDLGAPYRSPPQLEGLRLRTFVHRDDAHIGEAAVAEACAGTVDPEASPRPPDRPLEIRGPGLAVMAELEPDGYRLVARRGCSECVVDKGTLRVPVKRRVEDPPLEWPSGAPAGTAYLDFAVVDPVVDGGRACFSAENGPLASDGTSLRLCTALEHVRVVTVRDRGPTERPSLLFRDERYPVPPLPIRLRLPRAVVEDELRSRRDALLGCMTAHDRMHGELRMQVSSDGTARLVGTSLGDHADAERECLHEASNQPAWPTGYAKTSIHVRLSGLAPLAPRASGGSVPRSPR